MFFLINELSSSPAHIQRSVAKVQAHGRGRANAS
jgi:hypothetical protein